MTRRIRSIITLLTFLCISQGSIAQQDPLLAQNAQEQQKWVDSLYDQMTLDEKVGQLFMVRAYSNGNQKHIEEVEKLVKDYHVGGIIFSKGAPYKQALLNNKLQALAQTKMLMAMDAEWGLAMRLDSTFAYPYNMMLGAVKDDKIIEKVGQRIGEHTRRLGMHINFAPDVDINTNPDNPIIGNRSFGEDPENVARKAIAFTKGMQSAGVLANAKHFPGHGDTESDSHKTLPTISFSKERIDSVELYPYKRLFQEGLASVMVAHLNVPSLESRQNFPSTLSKAIVTDLLKERLNFKGLIFTDAMEMKGVANYDDPGEVDLKAFMAGNDILLISADTPKAIGKIVEAYNNNTITEERLAHSVKKILKAKFKVGLDNYADVATENLEADLNALDDYVLREEVIENAITVVQNKYGILPIKNLEKKKIAYVKFGDDQGAPFLQAMQRYAKVDEVSGDNLADLLENLKPYNTVIVGFHRSDATPWKAFKFTDKEKVWLYELGRVKDVVLDVFAKPYALLDLQTLTNLEGIIVSYQNNAVAQDKSAQVIFGGLTAKGILPVTSNNELPVGTSVVVNNIKRLQYGLPESVGMSSERLKKVDSMAQLTIKSGMSPGLQLLIARDGRVIYNKAFGRHIYGGDRNVKETDLYDLASLTKILATLPVVMKLEEDGVIDFNTRLGQMLPDLQKSNKEDLSLLKVLSHYARLKPWIPFYISTLDSATKKPLPKYYSKDKKGKFDVKVADNMYIRKDLNDSIFKEIKDSDLLSRLQYRYSDLGYFLMKRFIEDHYGESLAEITQKQLYQPLGAFHTTFNPLTKFKKGDIVPTEIDDYFRNQTLQGYVHDMGAAMQGGVGGHAGLFSTANDVAKIMQMYLQNGYYGGDNYFQPTTIDRFNTCYFCPEDVRRGVGFDKPQLGESGPTCGCVSMTSFGHSGFTGTYAWADPDQELVYVFLSNRTYPTMENRKLITEGVRTTIQEYIYEAIVE
ncbi:glycoside hydrolase family 3 N-terminal domain-containing protein [Zhouia amylolytica]|uniref:glycoside hydrolase family 3 N-terminal domain-containing protein n=1 Tax=Zhouia amylolytica TaxID=376730 RepID=UPI0020CCB99F|nr:glycoside hydrolase family 3 N-terminal domain-containing protein [Zhouia amylolytica]MCQ0112295.1 serine hydrolase [Zhouia amylolytica]